MCRIAGYFGEPIPISAVLADPPHSLIHQSYAPRELPGATHCGDGWGIGWFPSHDADAPLGRFRTTRPLWNDENAKRMAPAIFAASLVANARLAVPGIEVSDVNTPIYQIDHHVMTENGAVEPWPADLLRPLRKKLDEQAEDAIRGSTESEVFAALWMTLRRARHGDAADALREMLGVARRVVRRHGGKIKENILLAASGELLGVRFSDPDPPHTLYWLDRGRRWPKGTLIASEPLDDDSGWQEVPPGSLVRVGPIGATVEPLFP